MFLGGEGFCGKIVRGPVAQAVQPGLYWIAVKKVLTVGENLVFAQGWRANTRFAPTSQALHPPGHLSGVAFQQIGQRLH